MPNIVGAV